MQDYKIGVITPIRHLEGVYELLKSKGQVFICENGDKKETKEFLIKNRVNVILCNPNKQSYKIDESLLKNTEVRLINTCSTGTDHIDKNYCNKENITIYSLTKDMELINDLPSTAELAFGLMMSSLRHISKSQTHTSDFNWDYTKYMGTQIKNLNIGLVGYGRLGKLMKKYCDAFEAKVDVFDPYVFKDEKRTLNSFIKNLDVLSIHVHLNDETKHMINKDSLKNCKKNLLIVNTSRGGIVNESDVVDFLKSENIWGYSTDVLENENGSLKNSIILKNMKKLNIEVTPHVGGMTYQGQLKAYKWAINKL